VSELIGMMQLKERLTTCETLHYDHEQLILSSISAVDKEHLHMANISPLGHQYGLLYGK